MMLCSQGTVVCCCCCLRRTVFLLWDSSPVLESKDDDRTPPEQVRDEVVEEAPQGSDVFLYVQCSRGKNEARTACAPLWVVRAYGGPQF